MVEPNCADEVVHDNGSERSEGIADMMDDEAFDMAFPGGHSVEVDNTVDSDTAVIAGVGADIDAGAASVEAKDPEDSQGRQGIVGEVAQALAILDLGLDQMLSSIVSGLGILLAEACEVIQPEGGSTAPDVPVVQAGSAVD